MILDAILGSLLAGLGLVLELLPEATAAPAFDASGLTGVFGMAMAFDEGFPVGETLQAVGVYVAAVLVIDAFIAIRAILRWLPSWLHGGG